MKTITKNTVYLLVALFMVAACKPFTVEPPGVGEKAERGYAALEPVIKALEQYQAETGDYPESLHELAPNYLPSVPEEVNEESIYYEKKDASYTLSFHYIGPGMNTCTYTPEDKWQCSGAY